MCQVQEATRSHLSPIQGAVVLERISLGEEVAENEQQSLPDYSLKPLFLWKRFLLSNP